MEYIELNTPLFLAMGQDSLNRNSYVDFQGQGKNAKNCMMDLSILKTIFGNE